MTGMVVGAAGQRYQVRTYRWQLYKMITYFWPAVEVMSERYWITLQPGEVRICASCHGQNENNQIGQPGQANPPQALLHLLERWKNSASVPKQKVYSPLTVR
jgi:hypothetical protein